jgi:hypothetical protein
MTDRRSSTDEDSETPEQKTGIIKKVVGLIGSMLGTKKMSPREKKIYQDALNAEYRLQADKLLADMGKRDGMKKARKKYAS